MVRRCRAPSPDDRPEQTHMSDPSPQDAALQHLKDRRELFEALSEFQQSLSEMPPVLPQLPEVLQAANTAFAQGFSYTASFWKNDLEVKIHFGGAEIGSVAPATPTSYTDTCARLLAGLLGIPLREGEQADEPEDVVKATREADDAKVATDKESLTVEPEPEDEEFDELGAESYLPAEDIRRPLSEQEKAAAVDMVKAMPPDRRRAFTKTFREVFAVPADAKQIVPFISELQHLQFIDRYTVEAAGGVAA